MHVYLMIFFMILHMSLICCACLHTFAQKLICLSIFQHICVYLCIFALILKRCAAQFAAEWMSRELLGRPVARAMAVFVFSSKSSSASHIHTYLKKMRGAICYKMNVSRASGTPCGSSYGRFCIFQTFCAKISMSP